MPLIASYDADTGKLDVKEVELQRKRQGSAQQVLETPHLARRKRWWTVEVTYLTPEGPQELSVKPNKKCYLAQITPTIEAAIREDAAKTGWVRHIKWTATGR